MTRGTLSKALNVAQDETVEAMRLDSESNADMLDAALALLAHERGYEWPPSNKPGGEHFSTRKERGSLPAEEAKYPLSVIAIATKQPIQSLRNACAAGFLRARRMDVDGNIQWRTSAESVNEWMRRIGKRWEVSDDLLDKVVERMQS